MGEEREGDRVEIERERERERERESGMCVKKRGGGSIERYENKTGKKRR